MPETTLTYSFTPAVASGIREGLGAHPAPVTVGTQRSGLTPLPQKKMPRRFGIAPPSAYAVPLPLNMASSGGNATEIPSPLSAQGGNTVRRSTVRRLIRAFGIGDSS